MMKLFNNRTSFEKLMIIIIAILLIFGIYKSIQVANVKYQYIKNELKLKEVYKDSLEITKNQLKVKTNDIIKANLKAKEKAILINNKLKSDEKIIDNSTITNDEFNNVISKYERLVKN